MSQLAAWPPQYEAFFSVPCSFGSSPDPGSITYITSANVNELLLAVDDLCQIKWDMLLLLDLWWACYHFHPEAKLQY